MTVFTFVCAGYGARVGACEAQVNRSIPDDAYAWPGLCGACAREARRRTFSDKPNTFWRSLEMQAHQLGIKVIEPVRWMVVEVNSFDREPVLRGESRMSRQYEDDRMAEWRE